MTRSEFEHIIPALRPIMLQVALDFFGSHDDAEDTTQEAMLALWRYCERIDPERNVEALAVRVTKNCCVNCYRRRPPLATVSDGFPSPPSSPLSPSPHELLEAKDTQAMLAAALARLKPRERELFNMRQIEGLTNDEIVAQTGITKASVKVMVSAARKKVFDELKHRLKQ